MPRPPCYFTLATISTHCRHNRHASSDWQNLCHVRLREYLRTVAVSDRSRHAIPFYTCAAFCAIACWSSVATLAWQIRIEAMWVVLEWGSSPNIA